IAMATHGRSGLSRMVRGSVAERVLRSAPAPVLVVTPATREPGRFRRILVPLDGSDTAAHALPAAVAVAVAHDAEVLLLTVEGYQGPIEGIQPALRTPEQVLQSLEPFRARLVARGLAADSVRTLAGVGSPAEEILACAAREEVDLIAMSTHGHRFLADLILGSTARKVRHTVDIPVLLLKAPAEGAS
ncbi:MAG: universal stress protein, partial [Acidobacteria bacterium]|nr:universal stress protein [Acidobacteriota bacterium]